MKNLIWSCLAVLLSATSSRAIDASISYAAFNSPQGGYVELYLHFARQTVEFVTLPDSSVQANIEVIILFQQNAEIIKYDKYNLASPFGVKPLDFIDMKRYALPEGTYELVVAVSDLNRAENANEYKTNIQILFPKDKVVQSDLTLLASFERSEEADNIFVKNGILMEPLPFNFYGRNASVLSFYNEIYHTDQVLGDDFTVSYAIELLENGSTQTQAIRHTRQHPASVVPILAQMDISKLPSGNYQLKVEVRNRQKELLTNRIIFFQRSNPYLQAEEVLLSDVKIEQEFVQKLTPEQLEYSLRAMTPKLPQRDVELVNYLLKSDSIAGQRLYLFSFWAKESPTNPEFAYSKYMEVAEAVDQLYNSGFRHGFESDRGYIYLKYGQPDDTEMRDQEPSSPPYEIWTYYEFPATRQNNVKFVFYNPSLAPGDFQLLHSTAIGEVNNPQWQRQLYRSAPDEINSSDFIGEDGMQDNFNRNAGRIFKDN
ncbi:MAG TPA: GWxTD domain-containing protein [Saprospiraceae bacterium]|nr:GWxTD domain-containing protein [Saprospiraceae bacterium]HMQ84682.1 GWxTD domain-containing protein [Saprospiraceae bacterium]